MRARYLGLAATVASTMCLCAFDSGCHKKKERVVEVREAPPREVIIEDKHGHPKEVIIEDKHGKHGRPKEVIIEEDQHHKK